MSEKFTSEQIPSLETGYCSSWTVSLPDGRPLFETRSIPVMCSLYTDRVIIESTFTCLCRINKEIEVAGGSLPAAMERKIADAQSLIEQQQKSIQRNRRILNGLQDSIKAQNSYLPYFQSLGAFILALEPGQKATFARAIDDCPPLPVIEAFLGGFTTGLYWEHKFSLKFLAIELATIPDVC